MSAAKIWRWKKMAPTVLFAHSKTLIPARWEFVTRLSDSCLSFSDKQSRLIIFVYTWYHLKVKRIKLTSMKRIASIAHGFPVSWWINNCLNSFNSFHSLSLTLILALPMHGEWLEYSREFPIQHAFSTCGELPVCDTRLWPTSMTFIFCRNPHDYMSIYM